MAGDKKPDDGELHREINGGVTRPWDLIINTRRKWVLRNSGVPAMRGSGVRGGARGYWEAGAEDGASRRRWSRPRGTGTETV